MEQSRTTFGDVDEYNKAFQINTDSRIYDGLPLSDDGSSIRILQILPGAKEESIKCRLVVRQLSSTTRFEALSYTWGKLEEAATIVVNGHPLTVTLNLERALRHLRKRTTRRQLWVDAACIDQHNLEERAVQVMHMGQIYRNADQVLVWLGPAGEHTDLALSYVHWCVTKLDCDTFGPRTKPLMEQCCPLHYRERGTLDPLIESVMEQYRRFQLGENGIVNIVRGFECPRCRKSCWCDNCIRTRQNIHAGLKDVLRREWWERIWVVQEVAMAAGDPLVGCGTSWVAWSHLVGYESLGNYWPGKREPINHLQEIRLDIKKPPRLRDSMEPLPYSSDAAAADDVFHWLQRTASLQCRDPRDKIYALLGMARNRHWREFKPNYSISMGHLQSELVSQMITKDKNLDILTLCQPAVHTEHLDGWPQSVANSPSSWMPSFSVEGLPYLAKITLNKDAPFKELLSNLVSTAKDPVTISWKGLPSRGAELEVGNTTNDNIEQMAAIVLRKVLEVSGVIIDRVATFSVEHRLLLEFERQRDPTLYDLPYQALYYWAPVIRALDPAYLRLGYGADAAGMVSDLIRYFEMRASLHRFTGSREEREKLMEQSRERENTLKLKERVEAIERAMRGRKYFVSAQGLLGVGPSSLSPGDLLVLLDGSSAAYALRPLMNGQVQVDCSLLGNVFVTEPQTSYYWSDPVPPSSSWMHEHCQQTTFRIW